MTTAPADPGPGPGSDPGPAGPRGRADGPLVRIRGLGKRFGATVALDDVDLDVAAGTVHALLGQNGAGKSTLIKVLAGVYRADTGSVQVCGRPLEGTPEPGTIAFLHQDLGLVDGLSVAENVALATGFPRRARLIGWSAARRRAADALRLVGLDADPRTRVADLSRTERSLVAIGRALVTRSRVLVLDEPTASLPVDETGRLFDVLHRLRADGLGIVYVSHRLDEVFRIADEVTVLRDGRVVAASPLADTTPERVVAGIVGHTPVPPPPPAAAGAREVVLALDGVVGTGVGPVSLALRAGEVLGLVGLAGAGQAELGRAVAGAQPPHAGTLTLGGEPFRPVSVAAAVAAGVGLVTSNRAEEQLAMPLTVTENLLANPALAGWRGLRWQRHGAEDRRARGMVARFGIRPGDPGLAVEGLSGGNQQKVVLGRWLSTAARVLVLEEPTAGVDVGAKSELYTVLDDALRHGVAVLLISTDVEEVAAVCHRALVFRDGAVVREVARGSLDVPTVVALASGAAA